MRDASTSEGKQRAGAADFSCRTFRKGDLAGGRKEARMELPGDARNPKAHESPIALVDQEVRGVEPRPNESASELTVSQEGGASRRTKA